MIRNYILFMYRCHLSKGKGKGPFYFSTQKEITPTHKKEVQLRVLHIISYQTNDV